MIRLAISVEGQTEEEFVKSVLAPHLRSKAVEPTPILIGSARSGGAGGGDVNVARLASEMALLSWNFDSVTSLVDFYGFRDKENRTVEELEQCVGQEIQTRIRRCLDQRKVLPYVQKYEFEGLLFSDVQAFNAIGAPGRSILQLGEVRSRFLTPEEINDSTDTAPSKRIAAVVNYRKRLHGPLVIKETGLDVIRDECPRFHEWVSRLESLEGPK